MQCYERERTQQYFLYVKGACSQASQAQRAAAAELQASAAERMGQAMAPGCTAAVKHVLQEAAVHGARAVLLERSAAQHQRWYDQAVTAFASLTV